MPNICKELKDKLGLQPGDIIISEKPFQDAKLEDYNLKNPMHGFKATHVSIYTGDYDKPFAHALREGHKLPGVRLTKQWDGRHKVYRFADQTLAAKAAEIARRWAISTAAYDFATFDKTYPKSAWHEQYDYYKNEFFSLAAAVVPGPATPFDLARANKQISERTRLKELIDFNEFSLRRAIKFAARSGLFERISKGLRCTSFIIGVYQAAFLHAIVKQLLCKFPFKELKLMEINQVLNALLVENWSETEFGMKLKMACDTGNYASIFPGLDLDLKYAVPVDVAVKIEDSDQWQKVGCFIIHEAKMLMFENEVILPVALSTTPPPVRFSPLSPSLAMEVRSAPTSPLRSAVHGQDQTSYHLDIDERMLKLGTPPRVTNDATSTNNRSPRSDGVARKLF